MKKRGEIILNNVFLKDNNGFSFEVISRSRNILMAIAIIWIIFFHAAIPTPENLLLRVLWYIFFSFGAGIGVNIFFILSGFGLMYSNMKRCVYSSFSNWYSYILKRLKKLILIYVVIFIIYYILFYSENGSLLDFLSKFTIAELFITGFREFWFVHAILLLYLFFPLVAFLFDKSNKWIVFFSLMIISVFIEFLVYYFNGTLYSNIEIVLTRIPSFFIGNLLGLLSIKKYRFDIKLFILSFVVFVSSIAFAFFAIHFHFGNNRMLRYVFIVSAVALIMVLSFILANIHLSLKILKWLGTLTYQIYLTHILLFSIFKQYTTLNVWVVLLLVLIGSVVSSLFISLLSNYIGALVSSRRKQA